MPDSFVVDSCIGSPTAVYVEIILFLRKPSQPFLLSRCLGEDSGESGRAAKWVLFEGVQKSMKLCVRKAMLNIWHILLKACSIYFEAASVQSQSTREHILVQLLQT